MTGFVKAQRQRVFLKIAVTGPSGSGKTFSSLRLGFGLAGKGGKVALIDTENGSGSLYADVGDFDTMQIDAPFTVQKYAAAIKEAVDAGYDVVIIDSLSHAWAGEGGVLDQKTARDARGGNSFTNWAEAGKVQEQLKTAILQSDIHVIATMRSKQDYVLEQGQGGKQTPRKVGLAPVQREGMEYEFTTVFDVDMGHTAATSKDRTGLFTDEVQQITEQHGSRLRGWLSGASVPAPAASMTSPAAKAKGVMQEAAADNAETERKALMAEIAALIKPMDEAARNELKAQMVSAFGTDDIRKINLLGIRELHSNMTNTPPADLTLAELQEDDPFADDAPTELLIDAPRPPAQATGA